MAAAQARDRALSRARTASAVLVLLSLQVVPTDAGAQPTDHAGMKKTIEDAMGLSFSMESSVVSQMGFQQAPS